MTNITITDDSLGKVMHAGERFFVRGYVPKRLTNDQGKWTLEIDAPFELLLRDDSECLSRLNDSQS